MTTERGGNGWEVGGRFKREGTYVYLWLIHITVWQKPTQHCKESILQLKKKKELPLGMSIHMSDENAVQTFPAMGRRCVDTQNWVSAAPQAGPHLPNTQTAPDRTLAWSNLPTSVLPLPSSFSSSTS